jgi:hypothetical protein
MKLDLVDAQQYLGRPPCKIPRHFNLLILNNVPESVADFIQGRAPSTVGSMHYLAKVKQADEWYAKVVASSYRSSPPKMRMQAIWQQNGE